MGLTLLETCAVFGAFTAVLTALVVGLWPRHRAGIVVSFLLGNAVVYALFWENPGPVAVVAGMYCFGGLLRAVDIVRWLGDVSRFRFWLYLTLFTRDEERERRPEPRIAPGARVLRGAIMAACAAGLIAGGYHWQPWRISPYLDDVLMGVELAVIYMAGTDLLTPFSRKVGLKELGIAFEGLDARFWRSRSPREFWGVLWNRPTQGMLKRGIFDPVGGRRRLALATMATFLGSGLLHAVPLLLGGADRVLWVWIAVFATLFFLLHGLACLIEGAARSWRKSPVFGRVVLWGTFFLTLPMYPAPLGALLGFHQRPIDQLTPVLVLRAVGVLP